MQSQAVLPVATTASPGVLVVGAMWLLSYFLARYALDRWEPDSPWDVLVMTIPIFTFYWLVWAVQRNLRNADELQRRIHLEALALAFLSTMLTMMGLGLMEESHRVHLTLPWRDLWMALPPLYAFCFAVARWRYR